MKTGAGTAPFHEKHGMDENQKEAMGSGDRYNILQGGYKNEKVKVFLFVPGSDSIVPFHVIRTYCS